ncbi:DNA primase, partial [Patescibacteria group bacterium]|nr:DNA primase [Patescibacteria group bacterium]
WHCFGCGAGGDIFAFVKQIEGVEFADALRILARKAGVVLKRQDPQVQSQRKQLYDICELAAKFFEAQLEKSAGAVKVRQYLKERGLAPETIKAWRLGWAPDEWRALSDFLKSRGYKDEEIIQAGVAIKPETNETKTKNYELKTNYDRFRSRIIFPIFDLQGQVIAFGGRIFGAKAKDDAAKYLNSPQTPLYDKSRVLYGLHKNKIEIRAKDLCVIVEGYMDLLMSWQAGVANVAASSGTALTEEHLKIIGRYTKNLAMAFDTDLAGEGATRRSINLALAQDFYIKVISMEGKDPADVAKKNPTDWQKTVVSAQSIMDFYFTSTFAKYNSQEAEGRREIIKVLLPVIKAISSHTEQSEWLRELSRRLRVDEKDLMLDLSRCVISSESRQSAPQTEAILYKPVKSRQERLEERFLGLCLNNPQHLQNIRGVCETDFQNQMLGQIFFQLNQLVQKSNETDPLGRLQKSLPPELKLQIEYLSLKIEQNPTEELQVIGEIETCLKELKIVKIRQQLSALSYDIKDAQLAGNNQKLKEFLEKFSQLSAELIAETKNIIK